MYSGRALSSWRPANANPNPNARNMTGLPNPTPKVTTLSNRRRDALASLGIFLRVNLGHVQICMAEDRLRRLDSELPANCRRRCMANLVRVPRVLAPPRLQFLPSFGPQPLAPLRPRFPSNAFLAFDLLRGQLFGRRERQLSSPSDSPAIARHVIAVARRPLGPMFPIGPRPVAAIQRYFALLVDRRSPIGFGVLRRKDISRRI